MRSISTLALLALAACSGNSEPPAAEPVVVTFEQAPAAPASTGETAAREPIVEQRETLDTCLARAVDDAIGREPDPSAASTYARARSAERAGRLDESRKAYFELIQRHPRSPLVPFAYWAFAELFRESASTDPTKLAFARQAYEEVVKFPASGLERAAHARLVQILARMGEPERAMNASVKALGRPGEEDRALCGELVRAASFDDLLALYPGFGSPQKADALFRRLAKDDDESVLLMLRLAEAYAKAGSKDEALAALGPALARSSALPPAACLRASNIVEGAAAAGAKAVAETRAALNRACRAH